MTDDDGDGVAENVDWSCETEVAADGDEDAVEVALVEAADRVESLDAGSREW